MLSNVDTSIHQISIAPISPAKPDSVAQKPNRCSTAKLMKQFHNINGVSGMLESMGEKAKSKRCAFRCFLEVATEMAGWTDSGRFFQKDGAQEWNGLAPVMVLILGTDRWIPLFALSERDGGGATSKESLLCYNAASQFWMCWSLVR